MINEFKFLRKVQYSRSNRANVIVPADIIRSGMRLKSAYIDGYIASRLGCSTFANPREDDEDYSICWIRGWSDYQKIIQNEDI